MLNLSAPRYSFLKAVLRGVGQIMLQENAWTGLLFLIGLWIGNWRYALAALLATLVATLCSKLLKFDRLLIEKGIYGFNAALVGVALIFLFEDSLLVWLLILIIGGIFTPLLHHGFILKKKTVFTFPFILITWISFWIIHNFTAIEVSRIVSSPQSFMETGFLRYLAVIGGYGQVIFQEKIIVGFIFLLGVYLQSPKAAIYGLVASTLGLLVALLTGQTEEMIFLGLFGFNAVLTAIVFSVSESGNRTWAIIGVMLTLIIHIILVRTDWLNPVGGTLTFPFVLATWICLWLKKKRELKSMAPHHL